MHSIRSGVRVDGSLLFVEALAGIRGVCVYMGESAETSVVAGRQVQGDAQESERDHHEAACQLRPIGPHARRNCDIAGESWPLMHSRSSGEQRRPCRPTTHLAIRFACCKSTLLGWM